MLNENQAIELKYLGAESPSEFHSGNNASCFIVEMQLLKDTKWLSRTSF